MMTNLWSRENAERFLDLLAVLLDAWMPQQIEFASCSRCGSYPTSRFMVGQRKRSSLQLTRVAARNGGPTTIPWDVDTPSAMECPGLLLRPLLVGNANLAAALHTLHLPTQQIVNGSRTVRVLGIRLASDVWHQLFRGSDSDRVTFWINLNLN